MPQFSGNLKTIGIEPKDGLFPQITLTALSAGVNLSTSELFAGSRTFTPAANGDITLISATTVGMIPAVLVKLTGSWLGDDTFFELPPFTVQDTDGTLRDLVMNVVVGNDVVYTSPTAKDVLDDQGRRIVAGFQLNTESGILYKRVG